jgi:hypothetical protein
MNFWDEIIQGKWIEPIIEYATPFFIIIMVIVIGLILWYLLMGD